MWTSFGLICLCFAQLSWICMFVSFSKFGPLSTIVSSNVPSAPLSPSFTLGSRRSECEIVCHFPTGPRGTVHVCFLLISLPQVNSIVLSSSSLILFSVIPTVVLSASSKCSCLVLYFQSYNFALVLFHKSILLLRFFSPFICFKTICN